MILTFLVIAAIPLAGLTLSRRLWRNTEVEPLELALSSFILGTASWLALTWCLALAGALTWTATLLQAAAFVAFAAATSWRGLRLRRARFRAALLAPLAVWTAYIAWRAPFIPPGNHDALGYHFTKAVLLMRNHGFARFAAPDDRISDLPANYELLLAQMMLATGSDRVTEWIAVAAFIAFLIGTAALVQRWWSRAAPLAETVLAAAATPVVLLNSGAEKNDILTSVFCIGAILWGTRWAAGGNGAAVVMTVVSIAAALGTKPTAGVLVAGVGIPMLVRVIRHGVPWRRFLAAAAFAILCFALLGGAVYVANIAATGSPAGGSVRLGATDGDGAGAGFGDWINLLRVPYLMLAVPFSSSPTAVWVPWRSEYWFWPRYELFSSHFGAHFTLLVLALPFVLRGATDGRRSERRIGIGVTLLAAALFLPLPMRPVGFFNAFPRYLLFVVPVVCALAIPPLRARARRVAWVVSLAIAAIFTFNAIEYGYRDRFAPYRYVMNAARRGGTRVIQFRPQRAANIADRVAGANDTIAFSGGFDSWSYPAYGAGLSREVIFLPITATAGDVPAEAEWVVIDRGWNIIWGDPTFRDMGQFSKKISRGRATEDDLRLFESLRGDCRFELVWRDPRLNQAVFRRVSFAAPPGCG